MKDVNFRGFPQLAIAAGATTPVPSNSQRSIIWSTTESDWLGWNGTAWALVSPPGGSVAFTSLTDGPGSFTGKALLAPVVNAGETALKYAQVPLVYNVDFMIPRVITDLYFGETELWSPHTGYNPTTINLNHPLLSTLSSGPGLNDIVWLGDAGIFEITDVTTPSAAVLTRVPEFPSGHVIDYPVTVVCTQNYNLRGAIALAQTGYANIPYTQVDPSADTILLDAESDFWGSVPLDAFRIGFFASDATYGVILSQTHGGTVPGGLTEGSMYFMKVLSSPQPNQYLVQLHSSPGFGSVVDITSVSSGDTISLKFVPLILNAGDVNTYHVQVVKGNSGYGSYPLTVGTDPMAGMVTQVSQYSVVTCPQLYKSKYTTVAQLDFGTGAQAADLFIPDAWWSGGIGIPTFKIIPKSTGLSAPSNNAYEGAIAAQSLMFYSQGATSYSGDLVSKYEVMSTLILSGTFNVELSWDRSSVLPETMLFQ